MTEFIFVIDVEDLFIKIGHYEIIDSQSTFLKDGFRSSLNLRR